MCHMPQKHFLVIHQASAKLLTVCVNTFLAAVLDHKSVVLGCLWAGKHMRLIQKLVLEDPGIALLNRKAKVTRFESIQWQTKDGGGHLARNIDSCWIRDNSLAHCQWASQWIDTNVATTNIDSDIGTGTGYCLWGNRNELVIKMWWPSFLIVVSTVRKYVLFGQVTLALPVSTIGRRHWVMPIASFFQKKTDRIVTQAAFAYFFFENIARLNNADLR